MNAPWIVAALKKADPGLFDRLHSELTEERVFQVLKPLADCPAPSQTVPYTRGRLIEQMFSRGGPLEHARLHFSPNFRNTGNCVLLIGEQPEAKKVWLLAHLDVISYLIDQIEGERYLLMPFCYHMMLPGRQPGIALEYNLERKGLEIAAQGYLVTEASGSIFFEPTRPVDLHPGQRICFSSQLAWDRESGRITGSLDDAAGCAALLLAAKFLADYNAEIMVCLSDEEEGVAAAGNQTIGRGAARLLQAFDQPELVISCDFHEAGSMREGHGPKGLKPGDGAVFAEKASRARGEVTPPHLYEFERQLAFELGKEGIRLQENIGGYIGRSDGTNAMLRTPNVAILGFLGENRHFEQAASSANICDLADLAKVVVCYVLAAGTAPFPDREHGSVRSHRTNDKLPPR